MPLPILGLIAAFGPIIAELIPQLATIFKPKGEVAQRNIALAQTAFDTITKAAAATNVQEAVEKMQADPAVREAVTQAVVVQPEIMASLQIGPGGVDGARKQMEALIAPQPDDRWYSPIIRALFNPVFLVSMALLPLVYIIVLNLVSQIAKISADAVAGMLNNVIALALGGIAGFWLGQVYQQSQSRKQGGAETTQQ